MRIHTAFDLTGYPIGTYLGHRLFGHRQYTFGDVLMLIQGRSLGWFYAMMVAEIIDLDFEENATRPFGSQQPLGDYDGYCDGAVVALELRHYLVLPD